MKEISRRSFLKSAGVKGVSLALTPLLLSKLKEESKVEEVKPIVEPGTMASTSYCGPVQYEKTK